MSSFLSDFSSPVYPHATTLSEMSSNAVVSAVSIYKKEKKKKGRNLYFVTSHFVQLLPKYTQIVLYTILVKCGKKYIINIYTHTYTHTKAAFIKKYSKTGIVKYYNSKYFFYLNTLLKCSLFLWFKAEFSASLLRSSMSHDSSENISNMLLCCSNIIGAKLLIMVLIKVKTSFEKLFINNLETFIFQDSLNSLKWQHIF